METKRAASPAARNSTVRRREDGNRHLGALQEQIRVQRLYVPGFGTPLVSAVPFGTAERNLRRAGARGQEMLVPGLVLAETDDEEGRLRPAL